MDETGKVYSQLVSEGSEQRKSGRAVLRGIRRFRRSVSEI